MDVKAQTFRIGAGAGFSGDRIDAAVVLAERGELDVLIFECLAERTIALAHLRKQRSPDAGYDPLLERRMRAVLPAALRNGVRIVTNMGAANPLAAARAIARLADELGMPCTVAAVTGDDVTDVFDRSRPATETGRPAGESGRVVSANAYLGADALLSALQSSAQVIVTGRVADPALVLAPLVHHFGWNLEDWDRIAAGVAVGHLLECAGQLTGGYFADPGRKDVPDLANLGFPYADVGADGSAVFGKVAGTGGSIDARTVKEQLLYEAGDPSAYITPDVVLDMRSIRVEEIGANRVRVRGAVGKPRPSELKVSVGYEAGYRGEAEIGYAGTNCVARAELAGAIVAERLRGQIDDLRVELIGCNSLHGRSFFSDERPYEVRLRVAGRSADPRAAARIGEEVEALYTNGPAGGGGVRFRVDQQVGIVSTFIERRMVAARVELVTPHAVVA